MDYKIGLKRLVKGAIAVTIGLIIGYRFDQILITLTVGIIISWVIFYVLDIIDKAIQESKNMKIIGDAQINQLNRCLVFGESMNGVDFEQCLATLISRCGIGLVNTTPKSGDYGVDIIVKTNREKWVIQCKRYSNKVGIKPIQEVYAGKQYYHADVAIVATNSDFTKNAIELAKQTGVELWSGGQLLSLVNRYRSIEKAENKT